jgi:tetratricopeptide (TPR) repeat protein
VIIETGRGDGARFEELRSLAHHAVDGGRLEEAQSYIEQALAWAREHGTQEQVDHALCNRAALAIQLGRGEGELPALREILLRSGDPATNRLAAYHLSLHYEVVKSFKKSLFYARIARDRASVLGVPEWLSSSHNQLGNALLGESLIDEASREYEQALELMLRERSVGRAVVLDNLGYCRVLQKRFREGYTLLYEALSDLRRFRAARYQVLPHLDLCFAHLETGRYRLAQRQGLLGLRLAEETGQIDSIKNALYLLGEAANLSGDTDTAREHFTRLHRDYFPEQTYLPGFLLAVDVRKLVNLHA